MQHINSTDELKEAFRLIEMKQLEEARRIQEDFQLIFESLKPITLIKKSIHKTLTARVPGILAGLPAGVMDKKVYMISSGNPLRKLLGNALQLGIGNNVAQHPQSIKTVLARGLHKIFNKIMERRSEKVHEKLLRCK